jgi:hypothetical protein
MKIAIHEKLGTPQRRRQIILTPNILRRTGENGFSMSSVTPEIAGQSYDPVDIGTGTVLLSFVFESAHGLARQVFDQNCVFFVSLVPWSRRLKIKTDSTRVRILKFRQFTDLFASHAHRITTPQIDFFD